jgi:hypothetical protein
MVAAGDRIDASDISTLEDYTIGKPLVRLTASGTQALADNTQVSIAFSVEDIDTHGFHDTVTNNSRITPNVAGYYRLTGTVFYATQTTPVVSDINIRKNGSSNPAPGDRLVGQVQTFSLSCTVIQSANGTTDYFEIVARQDSAGANNTAQSVQFSSVFEAEFLRPL